MKNLEHYMNLIERNKIYEIILKNHDYLSITFSHYVIKDKRAKELKIPIMEKIE